jgi:hypothetical protein
MVTPGIVNLRPPPRQSRGIFQVIWRCEVTGTLENNFKHPLLVLVINVQRPCHRSFGIRR